MSESLPGTQTPRREAGEVDSESRREGGQSFSLSLGARFDRWSLQGSKQLLRALACQNLGNGKTKEGEGNILYFSK